MRIWYKGQEVKATLLADKLCYGFGISFLAGGFGAEQPVLVLFGTFLIVIGCLYAIPANKHTAS